MKKKYAYKAGIPKINWSLPKRLIIGKLNKTNPNKNIPISFGNLLLDIRKEEDFILFIFFIKKANNINKIELEDSIFD